MVTFDGRIGDRKFVWWDRSLWWRVYHPGGFDGFRTFTGRRLPCHALDTALRRPEWREEIATASRWKRHTKPKGNSSA